MPKPSSPLLDRFRYVRTGVVVGTMVAGFLADQALSLLWQFHSNALLKTACAVAPITLPATLVLPGSVFEAGRNACMPTATFHTVAAQMLMLKVNISFLVWIFELYFLFAVIASKDDTYLNSIARDLLKRDLNSFREDIRSLFWKSSLTIIGSAIMTYIPLNLGIYETFSIENPLRFDNFMTNFSLGLSDLVALTSMRTLFLAKIWFEGHNV